MPRLKVMQGNSVTDIHFEGMPVLSFALLQYGFLIETPCGGKGVCGKCRMLVEGSLSEITSREREHVTPSEIAQGVRLACQVRLLGDASVFLPMAAEFVNIQAEGGLPAFHFQPMEGR